MKKPDHPPVLLSRDAFRETVFKRDRHCCVMCGQPAVDAHHIMDRKLWADGGNYAENGASLCAAHHLEAEHTTLSCEEIRKAAGIPTFLPAHLEKEYRYDKWGNTLLANGTRYKGELFFTEPVQKVLKEANLLSSFAPYIKFPRTNHLPWSPNLQNNDRRIETLANLENQEVVVSIKMDGESFTMYRDYSHARSLDSKHHPSRSYAKKLHGEIAYEIPEGWRVCCENLYAQHSIVYHHLPAFILVHSIWNEKNFCLSWDETKEWAELLGLKTVPVVYEGKWDEEKIKSLYQLKHFNDPTEGYVVRVRAGFTYNQYAQNVAKFVRQGHVQTDAHWMEKPVVPNHVDSAELEMS